MDDSYSFDATKHEPAQDVSDPIPADWYIATVDFTEIKPTKAGDGKILELTWKVMDGAYKGRKVWDRFNVVNPSEKAQQIAEQQLSAVCHATGVLKFRQHEQLRGKSALIRVVVIVQDGYSPKNEVKAWKADDDRPAVRAKAPVAARTEKPDGWQPDDDDDFPF